MNEIVTFCKDNINLNELKIFVHSSINYCDKLTILGLNLDDNIINFLTKTKVNFVDVKKIAEKAELSLNTQPEMFVCIIYFLYIKTLEISTNILFVNFSNLLIQKNCFELLIPNKISLWANNSFIKNDRGQTNILYNLFEKHSFEYLVNKPNVNMSFILGTKNTLYSFLEEIILQTKVYIKSTQNINSVILQALINKVVYFDEPRFKFLNHELKETILNIHNDYTLLKVFKVNGKLPYFIENYKANTALTHLIHENFTE